MPTAELIVATPANTKFLNLWNGTSNDTPPTNWWQETYDDSAWETPIEVTPDPDDPRYTNVAPYGLTPMWGATDSAGTQAIILIRTHFTAPATITDGFGIPLVSTDIFNRAMQVSSGAYETSGQILDGSGRQFDLTFTLNEYYNGDFPDSPGQPPAGPCVAQRAVSNLNLGADNVFAAAINLGLVDCHATVGYGPWNPATRSSHTTWFALGFRFFTEPCSEYGHAVASITVEMAKALRFSGAPPANWQTVAFDDSTWLNAVDTGIDNADGWANGIVSGTQHINGEDVSYNPIARPPGIGSPNPDYLNPPVLWAIPSESTVGESVILRIRYTPPSLDSFIRDPIYSLSAGGVNLYDGTVLARDWAGFSSVTSYVNGLGGGAGIEHANFNQLIVPGQENLIAILMTTTSGGLAAGFGAWIQLGVQLANCGPYTPPSNVTPTTRVRRYGQVVG